MDIFTHFLIGILISFFSLHFLGPTMVIYAAFMAIFADLDVLFFPIINKFLKSPLFSHKGISHSIFFAIVPSFIVSLIIFPILNENFFFLWFIGWMFYDLHLVLDFLGASKIPILFPFSKKRYRFFVDRAINFFLALISSSFLGLYLFFYIFFSNLIILYLSVFILVFYILYLTMRILLKLSIQFTLSEDDHYIPGISPFNFYIYTHHLSPEFHLFKLIKKYIFSSKEILIIENNVEVDIIQGEFYKKSLQTAEKYPFFLKWDNIIPMIEDTGALYIITLFLAESYFKGRSYAITIEFDKISKNEIQNFEGFNKKLKNND